MYLFIRPCQCWREGGGRAVAGSICSAVPTFGFRAQGSGLRVEFYGVPN